ncbi:hypothetical protein R1sor_003585 [Riccia sorocarpa]|uniref:Phosphate acetyl/butaryl transferase domain-containing protein n=1 Tax=Riccia sorocarpa TaxID=122646 RepID=A0ABD3H205_9MARC
MLSIYRSSYSKVTDATEIAKKKRPDLLIEGSAAVNPETAKTKLKGKDSPVAGKIHSSLSHINCAWFLDDEVRAVALGLLQGLKKPVNDLSRGCTVHVTDIVTTIALTAVQGIKQEEQLIRRFHAGGRVY